MANLTANKEVEEQHPRLMSMAMAGEKIFKGALCNINAAGFIAKSVAEAGAVFAGVAYEQVDNSAGSAGDLEIKILRHGVFKLSGAGFAQTDVGQSVYASDDQTISKTQGTNEVAVGKIVKFISAAVVYVEINK